MFDFGCIIDVSYMFISEDKIALFCNNILIGVNTLHLGK